jgi:hypothetical protein
VAAIGVVVIVALIARPSKSETVACAVPSKEVIPEWARTGFSDPRPRVPHVLGHDGEIVAILFGGLYSPPRKDEGNKVLWVAKDPVQPLSDLRISAQRVEDGRAVGKPAQRTVAGGPGPSGIEMPAAGCWRMTLRWSGRTDELELRYRRP